MKRISPDELQTDMKQRHIDDIAKAERRYPCDDCGALRTKAEGGTVFTVCDDCWERERRSDERHQAAD